MAINNMNPDKIAPKRANETAPNRAVRSKTAHYGAVWSWSILLLYRLLKFVNRLLLLGIAGKGLSMRCINQKRHNRTLSAFTNSVKITKSRHHIGVYTVCNGH